MNFRSLFFVFLVALGAVTDLMAQAQEAPVVREIEIQYAGPPAISRERILANMRTQVGKPYSQMAVEEDIRNLYATGNVTNVRIFGEAMPTGVKVIVVVQSKATLSEVMINGAGRVKVGRLRKELTVKPGEVVDENKLESDRQKLLTYYKDKGFTEVDIQYRLETDEATGKAKAVFDINEGGKVAITDIRFEGNDSVKEKVLMKQIKTRPKSLVSFLTKTGRLDSEKLSEDVAAIRTYYQNQGYADVQVSEPRIDRTGDKVVVTFPIVEGPVYKVGSMTVTGGNVFTEDQLRSGLKTKEGGIYSPEVIGNDLKSLRDLYGSRGYVDMRTDIESTPAGPGMVDVNFVISEGEQAYVDRVNITGNTRTKDKVIRRELAVAPGDIYNTVRVDASKERLKNLNYFEKVEAYDSATMVPGRKDLNVVVEEKKTGSFNFGVGFSSIDSLLGFVEVQQGNFDLLGYPSFTGGGQKFRSRIQYGTQRSDFVIALTEPWFMDYQLAVGGEIFYTKADYVSSVYSQTNYGFELNARKPIGPYTAIRGAYRLENIGINDVAPGVSEEIRQEEGERLKSSITAGIVYDTRDSVFLTRRGRRIEFTGSVAGGPLGGDTDIYGLNFEASQYLLLPWDTILMFNGEVGTVTTWAGGDRVPIFDRLYLGGAQNLRGFDYRDVSPRDINGEPIGGNTMARFTVEYTVPIVERVRGAIFFDTGFVNSGDYDFSTNNINSDVGVGVRLNLPIGPVRIDYGIPVQTDQFNDSGSGKFNFNIGYQF
jgi:outer membrane protein insertion porin family